EATKEYWRGEIQPVWDERAEAGHEGRDDDLRRPYAERHHGWHHWYFHRYGYHDYETSLRPLVRIDPVNGLPNLLTGRHAHNIVGMDPQESETLLDWLADHACTPDRMYHHQWTVGDAIIWDNRWLMHQATPFDMTEPRVMWHTRIAGEPESESATNHMPQPD
ncbi:MAG: TauD/TfdA family dioxygenase, partial [Actinomycetia bacterium]|nr:TauD/TfdA family dioxygenase [Actinomycetes bacterium]